MDALKSLRPLRTHREDHQQRCARRNQRHSRRGTACCLPAAAGAPRRGVFHGVTHCPRLPKMIRLIPLLVDSRGKSGESPRESSWINRHERGRGRRCAPAHHGVPSSKHTAAVPYRRKSLGVCCRRPSPVAGSPALGKLPVSKRGRLVLCQCLLPAPPQPCALTRCIARNAARHALAIEEDLGGSPGHRWR